MAGSKIKDRVGERYGTLTVISFAGVKFHQSGNKSYFWNVRCDCGEEFRITTANLTQRNSSCYACRNKKIAKSKTTHGQSDTKLYRIWRGMITRCETPSDTNYVKYGAKGIRVCARWRKSFEAFVADVGTRPTLRHTLDRKNPFKNYTKSNVRWATPAEQARNKRIHWKDRREAK